MRVTSLIRRIHTAARTTTKALAYRCRSGQIAANGQPPVMVWAQHRTTGRWIHVAAYSPYDIALYIGLATYKQTKHLAQPAFFQATYSEAA